MKKASRIITVLLFAAINIFIIYHYFIVKSVYTTFSINTYITWGFYALFFLSLLNEGHIYIKNSKRSEWGDLVIIGYLFVVVFLVTNDAFDAFLGSFSIYLLLGISELKDYDVINKILYISIITYNLIFISGIIDKLYLNPERVEGVFSLRDTVFGLSFWIMLILGFIFFGRKYIIIWRFMSPQYLVLGLYIVAWLGITTISELTGSKAIYDYIYQTLLITDLIVYMLTGPLIDKLLGLKNVDDPVIQSIVDEVATKMGMNPSKIKVRFGEYPILNAMAYGAFWDKRMAIIAPNIHDIAQDELKGIVAHEMAHLKGKHTLSLTLISIGDIVIRYFLKWPVTYYDYTFAPERQPFSMGVFILLNFIIYIFLFIFVRMFEAQADLNSKRAGYGKELAKGLYNLESFYASGREIGLNTMLLCEEKITKENQLLDYMETAQYLNNMNVRPKKSTLLSNLMNSHPPSFHRILASLHDEEISIVRESLMPFTLLKRKNSYKWFLETRNAQNEFQQIATDKIKTLFEIEHIGTKIEELQQREMDEPVIGKTFVFLNLLEIQHVKDLKETTNFIGKIIKIHYRDNACTPTEYEVQQLRLNNKKLEPSGKVITIDESLYKKVKFSLHSQYYLKKENTIAVLENINLEKVFDEKKSIEKIQRMKPVQKVLYQGVFTFQPVDQSQKEIIKPLFKYRLPIALDKLDQKTTILRKRATYSIENIKSVNRSEMKIEKDQLKGITFKLNTIEKEMSNEKMVINYGKQAIMIHNDEATQDSEKIILEDIFQRKFRVKIFLKKPINNIEEGRISNIIYNEEEEKNSKITSIEIENIFNNRVQIKIKELDALIIMENMLLFQNKKEISGASMIAKKLGRKFHPEKILF